MNIEHVMIVLSIFGIIVIPHMIVKSTVKSIFKNNSKTSKENYLEVHP